MTSNNKNRFGIIELIITIGIVIVCLWYVTPQSIEQFSVPRDSDIGTKIEAKQGDDNTGDIPQ